MLTLLMTDKLGLASVNESSNDDEIGPEAKAFLKKIMSGIQGEETPNPAA
jgi:hypothetical protein